MTNGEIVLSRDERDEMMKAVAAIQRQLKVMVRQPQPHDSPVWVIGTNLAIIQAKLISLPRFSSN